jgi:hypothetical protein
MNQGYFKKEEKREEEKREKSFRGEGLFIKSPSPRTPLFKKLYWDAAETAASLFFVGKKRMRIRSNFSFQKL